MTLYDRILERAWTTSRRRPLRTEEAGLERDLKTMPVYDLTDVVPLFNDWMAEKNHPVPRRPPHHALWVEWSFEDTADTDPTCVGFRWRIGWFIHSILFEQLAPMVPLASLPIVPRADAGDVAYLCFTFRRLDHLPPGHPEATKWDWLRNRFMGLSCDDEPSWFVCYSNHTVEAGKIFYHKLMKHAPPHGLGYFDVPVFGEPVPERGDYCSADGFHSPTPAIMAFALLHCKNVITVENAPEERIQRECRKHGRPPRVTYKTLRLEVPQSSHRRQSLGDDNDSEPKVRFHLCRGHFKNLQHERYKVKGWHWWPATWRGSRNLGVVAKDYKLEKKGT